MAPSDEAVGRIQQLRYFAFAWLSENNVGFINKALCFCVLEQERQRERREQKMRDLLEDYFYRSDHVEVQWEDQGRDKIMKHSFVKDMDEEDW